MHFQTSTLALLATLTANSVVVIAAPISQSVGIQNIPRNAAASTLLKRQYEQIGESVCAKLKRQDDGGEAGQIGQAASLGCPSWSSGAGESGLEGDGGPLETTSSWSSSEEEEGDNGDGYDDDMSYGEYKRQESNGEGSSEGGCGWKRQAGSGSGESEGCGGSWSTGDTTGDDGTVETDGGDSTGETADTSNDDGYSSWYTKRQYGGDGSPDTSITSETSYSDYPSNGGGGGVGNYAGPDYPSAWSNYGNDGGLRSDGSGTGEDGSYGREDGSYKRQARSHNNVNMNIKRQDDWSGGPSESTPPTPPTDPQFPESPEEVPPPSYTMGPSSVDPPPPTTDPAEELPPVESQPATLESPYYQDGSPAESTPSEYDGSYYGY